MEGVAIELPSEKEKHNNGKPEEDDGESVKSNHIKDVAEEYHVDSPREESNKSDESAFAAGLKHKDRGVTEDSQDSFGPNLEIIPSPNFATGSSSPVRRHSFCSVVSAGSSWHSTPDWQSKWHAGGERPFADNPVLGARASRRRTSFDLGDCRELSAGTETPKTAGIRDAKLLASRRKRNVVKSPTRSESLTRSPERSGDLPVMTEQLISLITDLDAKMDMLLEASKRHGSLLEANVNPQYTVVRPAPLSRRGTKLHSREVCGPMTLAGVGDLKDRSPRSPQRSPRKNTGESLRDTSPSPSRTTSHSKLPGVVEKVERSMDRLNTGESSNPSEQWGSLDSIENERERIIRSAFESQKFEIKRDFSSHSLCSASNPSSPIPARTSFRMNSSTSKISAGSNASSAAGGGFSSNAFGTVMSIQSRNNTLDTIWRALDEPELVSYGHRIAIAMDTVVIVSVCITFIQLLSVWSTDSWAPRVVELFFDALFLTEVLVRFLSCPNRKRFFFSLYNLIDLMASVPVITLRSVAFFVFMSSDRDVTAMDDILLCLVPILRLLKLLRRFKKFSLLFQAFVLAFEALPVLLFTLAIIILMFSSTLYLLETRESIPGFGLAVYATIISLTTVGYGDVVPGSTGGKALMCLLGIVSGLYMALPLGIVGNAFKNVWDDRDRLMLLRRLRKTLLDLELTAYDIPSLFRYFDVDKDGLLSIAEFGHLVSQMHLNMSNRRVEDLFLLLDKDGDGGIDDEEFTRSLFPAEFAVVYGPHSEGNNNGPD